MRPSRILLVAGVAVVVFVLDRVTKAWVSENIPLGTARPVVGDYVRIVHAQNTGAAFGLLPERTTLLSVLSVVAVLAIVYYYRQIASNSALVSATLGMQLGGAFEACAVGREHDAERRIAPVAHKAARPEAPQRAFQHDVGQRQQGRIAAQHRGGGRDARR